MSASAWWKRTTAKLGMGADSGDPGRADAASAMGRRLRRKFILVAMGAVTAYHRRHQYRQLLACLQDGRRSSGLYLGGQGRHRLDG